MKKILYIRENAPGGTDNYCKSLYSLFQDDADLQPLPVEDIPAVDIPLLHYYYRQKALKEAISKADIVHINGYTAIGSIQALLTAKRLHKKIVYTAHWHPFQCLGHPTLGRLFFWLIFRPAIKKCAHVVTTINNEDTAFFQSFHRNVVQIPHWYKPKPMSALPPKKPNMILFVGRTDDPVKGFWHLYHLPAGKYDVHCVGKGTVTRKDFHQHVAISDTDLAALYAEASLVVIPSKYEAFSYVALEAMTYGTPVVMSERVRIADYLQGIKGYQVFQYGNSEEFLQKISSMLGTDVDTEKISEIFNLERVRRLYQSIYL